MWITEPSTDTQYRMEVDNGVLKIEFQGSTSKIDWLHNFSFWVKPYKRMRLVWFAHSGMVKKWRSVEDQVFEKMAKLEGWKRIVVFGFSQGAGIATLCHESIRFHFSYDVETVLTGSLRTIWFWNMWKIKNRFEGVRNIQRRWDLVCHLPPWLFGYLHIGRKKKLRAVGWPWQVYKNHMSYGGFNGTWTEKDRSDN